MKTAIILKQNINSAKLIAEYLKEKCIQVLHITDNPDVIARQAVWQCDIVIIDKSLPESFSGLELARTIKKRSPKTYCIVCILPEDFHANLALYYDVNGYLSVNHSLTDLVACIETIQEGYRYLCPAIKEHIGEPVLQEHALQEPIYDISEQEKKVLQLMLSGMKAKDIADQLYISVNTLNNHKTNIRNKLKLHSNRELLSFAVKNNIVKLKYASVFR